MLLARKRRRARSGNWRWVCGSKVRVGFQADRWQNGEYGPSPECKSPDDSLWKRAIEPASLCERSRENIEKLGLPLPRSAACFMQVPKGFLQILQTLSLSPVVRTFVLGVEEFSIGFLPICKLLFIVRKRFRHRSRYFFEVTRPKLNLRSYVKFRCHLRFFPHSFRPTSPSRHAAYDSRSTRGGFSALPSLSVPCLKIEGVSNCVLDPREGRNLQAANLPFQFPQLNGDNVLEINVRLLAKKLRLSNGDLILAFAILGRVTNLSAEPEVNPINCTGCRQRRRG